MRATTTATGPRRIHPVSGGPHGHQVQFYETDEFLAEVVTEFLGEGLEAGDRLAQVFSNLVGNAVQHGDPAQGVRVVIDGTAQERVRLDVHNAGSIPPDLVPRLFVPFDAEKRRRSPQGLGLGLFISREVVSAHGGTVEVSSCPARGTTFVVTLPRA